MTKKDETQLKQDIKDLKLVMSGTKDDIKKRYGWS